MQSWLKIALVLVVLALVGGGFALWRASGADQRDAVAACEDWANTHELSGELRNVKAVHDPANVVKVWTITGTVAGMDVQCDIGEGGGIMGFIEGSLMTRG